MKIQISQDGRGHTTLKVDGTELNMITTGFSLSQKVGEVPVLNLEILPAEGFEVELPHGIVIAQAEKAEE